MEYTDREKEEIGIRLANLFHIPQSKREKGRYLTSWGTKTPIGVFEVMIRISQEIETGNIIKLLG